MAVRIAAAFTNETTMTLHLIRCSSPSSYSQRCCLAHKNSPEHLGLFGNVPAPTNAAVVPINLPSFTSAGHREVGHSCEGRQVVVWRSLLPRLLNSLKLLTHLHCHHEVPCCRQHHCKNGHRSRGQVHLQQHFCVVWPAAKAAPIVGSKRLLSSDEMPRF